MGDRCPKKFDYQCNGADLKFYVLNGFVIYENIFDQNLISGCQDFFFEKLELLKKIAIQEKLNFDYHGWSIAIVEKFTKSKLGDEFFYSSNMCTLMKRYLGTDLALLNQDALWINVPEDTDPVLNKNVHTDAWTGTSINTIFAKTFFTDVDEFNSMSVVPGSHLYGMTPVRNRSVDPRADLSIQPVNLINLKKGDVLIWHPLLLHSTTGHSGTNTRISLTSRYTSTETPFSSQERSLGYRVLSVGVNNQILRLIGNDYLTPFRTLGGFVGIDKRLQKLYGLSEYNSENDYESLI